MSQFAPADKFSEYKYYKKVNRLTISSDNYNLASEGGEKPVIIITSEPAEFKKDGRLNPEQSIIKRANTLNHEENIHGINTLASQNISGNKAHKEYYGEKCDDYKDNLSPSDEDVMTKDKYKDSEAYKNMKQIEEKVRKMDYF